MKDMPNYKTLSDAALIALLRSSDGDAFIEVFYRYRSVLLLFSYHRLKDLEGSKALIFESFTDLWMKRKSMDISGELRPFLLKMIREKINKKAN